MAQLDPNIILSGISPNVFGNFVAGQQAGMQAGQAMQKAQHENALRAAMQEHGAGLVRGDEAAINALAGIDPTLVMEVQQAQHGMADSDRRFGLAEQQFGLQQQQFASQQQERAQRLTLAYEQASREAEAHVARMSAHEREQALALQDRQIAGLVHAHTPEDWDRIAVEVGADELVGRFADKEILYAQALGVKDALAMNQPAGFRQATPEEAAQYGAQAGQFGPDGRFYPVNPPSGMTLRQTSDGFEFAQGAGVGMGTPGAGTAPQGYRIVEDPSDPQGWRMEPIPGGPAAQQQEAEAAQAEMRQEQTERYANVALDDIGRAREIVQRNPNWTTGTAGNLLNTIPGTAAHDLGQILMGLNGYIAFDRLQQMREASPTGGALGAVSDREIALLQSAYGSLAQSQTTEQFLYNLDRFERIIMEIVHGPQAAQQAGAAPQAGTGAAQADGWTIEVIE